MGFFDLNIPYTHPPKRTVEASRTRIAVKAMELGYTGIAYNRTISGVISDEHRCSIKPLSISSLLNTLPSLSLSAKLHRDLLRIPLSTPFRQYTRVTVLIETPLHATAVCCDNPILKTYDLVAIKPSTRATFDMACQKSEVDIITVDFSKGMPCRMTENMVKVAAERGVCFEVDYSCLLNNAKIRDQWIYGAKCLMEWTQGRNVIFSSSAPSVNLLRGPWDVANLLSILGISKERARDAISKNCRNLLVKALRKKRFYKNAIRVQPSSSNTVSNFEDDQQEELLKWDSLSSEGDIPLNDWAKCFLSLSSKASEIAPVVDSMPSHGFQTKDFLPSSNASPVVPNGEKISQSTPVLKNSTEQPNRQDESSRPDAMEADQVAMMTMTTTPATISTKKSCPTRCSQLHGSNDILLSCNKLCEKTKKSIPTETFNSRKSHDSQSNLGTLGTELDAVIQNENSKLQKFLQDAKRDDEHDSEKIFYPNLNAKITEMQEAPQSEDLEIAQHTVSKTDISISKNLLVAEQSGKLETEAVKLDEMEIEEDGSAVVTHIEDQKLNKLSTESDQVSPVESVSGRSRVKRRRPPAPPLFPFKRLFSRMLFKRKGRKKKSKTKPE
ncbi:protein GAMETOPHYTE DEFECTIVE 1-like [Arachis stenosperma]|uniref:protein GAMETOPHYTE DEFECTIVE 1-like n=1 Tax=Arachis stenosperma TaxID=217475 RepID=UPI0025AD1BB5|nr:protein GAMETOPHYTE DEFECTIVE 1-like [Arachis stenosperma]